MVGENEKKNLKCIYCHKKKTDLCKPISRAGNPFQLSNKYHDYRLSSITDDSYDSVQFPEVYLS